MFVWSELEFSITSPSFVTLHLLVSEINVSPEAVYCCFTRTTSFTTMFTVIIVVCLLKHMCMPSFILSKSHGHLCPYRNVLSVTRTIHCLQTCNFPIPWLLWIAISTQSFISQLPLVIEIRWSKLKKKNNNNYNDDDDKEKMKKCEMNFYNFNNFPVIRFWSFVEDPHMLAIGSLS